MEWLTELLALLLAALFALGGYLLGRYSKGAAEDKIRTVTEVVTVRDTVTIEKPVYIERKVTETMLVEVRDTVLRHDTLYIKLPREEVVYEGEDYRAQVTARELHPCTTLSSECPV